MKTLELLGKNIKVDTTRIATGLKEVDPEIYIGFGIFKAELMQMAENGIKTKVYSQFDAIDQDAFKSCINGFITECMHDITVQLMN